MGASAMPFEHAIPLPIERENTHGRQNASQGKPQSFPVLEVKLGSGVTGRMVRGVLRDGGRELVHAHVR